MAIQHPSRPGLERTGISTRPHCTKLQRGHHQGQESWRTVSRIKSIHLGCYFGPMRIAKKRNTVTQNVSNFTLTAGQRSQNSAMKSKEAPSSQGVALDQKDVLAICKSSSERRCLDLGPKPAKLSSGFLVLFGLKSVHSLHPSDQVTIESGISHADSHLLLLGWGTPCMLF